VAVTDSYVLVETELLPVYFETLQSRLINY